VAEIEFDGMKDLVFCSSDVNEEKKYSDKKNDY